ncbi:pancreatic triacylglycerol lipase [Trichonephila clavipes]|nr:pancreatic triacylglycerol lipase [Trichonephila clavipes]
MWSNKGYYPPSSVSLSTPRLSLKTNNMTFLKDFCTLKRNISLSMSILLSKFHIHIIRFSPPPIPMSWAIFVEKTVCYHGLGCFSNGPPFYHPVYRPLSPPPQPPEVIKTMFLLYTRRNKHRPIFLNQKNVKKSTFDPSSLTRVIIHGFNDNQVLTSWFQRIKDVLLERADENVLIVDWTANNRLPYSVTVANSRVVGAQIAHFINYLYKTMGTSPESFHLIGHSVGAHVAGYAGERLHKLGRITAKDSLNVALGSYPSAIGNEPRNFECGHVTITTLQVASPLQTSTPRQHEDLQT